ncbi:MAG: hypothetical protein EOO59_01995 [Hymenobacter sp.]|nr:MAG: hypothetical protein EOO59_01995 [Hymenobacter sp.]
MKHHYALAPTLTAASLALGLLLSTNLVGNAQDISTVAGAGTANTTNNGIGYTRGVSADAGGNVFVATGTASVIRKAAADGTHSTRRQWGAAGSPNHLQG